MFRRVACPRLIGRNTELVHLISALERAEGGVPVAVFLAGEAGVGKTRLLREFGELATARGARLWTGSCLPVAEGLIPYAPVADLLHGMAADLGVDELRALAGTAVGWLSLLAPELATTSDDINANDADRSRLHAAWWHLLERLAIEPAVVVLEDLHWADASTRDLLAGLASAQRRGRLLVVGTFRDDELPVVHPLRSLVIELVRAGADQLRLAPLDLAHTAEQIAGILRVPPEPGVVERVFARTGGNPFFVEELLASDPGALDLPDSLRDTVLNRVRHLPGAVQRVLRAVALASHDVEHVLLDEMLGLHREALQTALRQAVERQLLVVRGNSYAFRHAIVAEAMLAELLPGERIDMHRAWASAIESRAGEQADASTLAEIAHHWIASRAAEHALPACVRAGVAAQRTLAFAEARKQFERAIELWGQVPQAHDRVPMDLLDLYDQAATAAYHEGALPEALRLVRRGIDQGDVDREPARVGLLYEQLGRYLRASAGTEAATLAAFEQAVRLVPDTPTPARARVLTGLAIVHAVATRHLESQRLAERAVQIARQIGAADEEWRALVVSGINLARLGATDEGIAELESASAIAEQRGRPEGTHAALCNLSDVLLTEGRLAEAADVALRGHDTLSRQGVVFTNLLSNGLDALFLLGRWEQVAQLAAHTSPPEHAVFCQVSLQVHRAALDTAQGRFAQAHTHLDGCGRIVAFSVRKDLFAEWCVASADLHLWEGDPYAAQQIVADVMTELTAGNYALPLAQLLATGARAEADLALAGAEHRSLAETVAALPDRASMAPLATAYLTMAAAELARIGDDACAEAWALAAKHWDRLCCPYLLAYARWRQAEALLAGRGRRRAAVAALAESHRTATRLGAVPLAQETLRLAVRARLDLADAPDGAGGPVPERLTAVGLTDRETDVLRLLAEGRTNRQIARSLFISESTVSIHVSRVLSKLGARNRTTAVTTAHRTGLLPPPKAG